MPVHATADQAVTHGARSRVARRPTSPACIARAGSGTPPQAGRRRLQPASPVVLITAVAGLIGLVAVAVALLTLGRQPPGRAGEPTPSRARSTTRCRPTARSSSIRGRGRGRDSVTTFTCRHVARCRRGHVDLGRRGRARDQLRVSSRSPARPPAAGRRWPARPISVPVPRLDVRRRGALTVDGRPATRVESDRQRTPDSGCPEHGICCSGETTRRRARSGMQDPVTRSGSG